MAKQSSSPANTSEIRILARIRGIAPGLLMHSGVLADPLSAAAKAIKSVSSRRKKSDEDHLELARLEFKGSMYYDPKLGPVMPGNCLDATLIDGAKRSKAGKAFKAQVFCDGEVFRLEYDGPRDIDALWDHGGFRSSLSVRVGTARVIRTRPIFRDWAVEFNITVVPGAEVNPEDVKLALTNAGMYSGTCDFRPKYGRFVVEKFAVA